MRWERFVKNCAFAIILFLLVNLAQAARWPGTDLVREYIAFAFTSDWDYQPALDKAQEGLRTLASYTGRFTRRMPGEPAASEAPAAPEAPVAAPAVERPPDRAEEEGTASPPVRSADPHSPDSVSRPEQAAPGGNPPLAWPAAGRISERYGRRQHPVYRLAGPHEGIDIAATTGTPVAAAAPGKVAAAFRGLRSGLTVDLAHDGFLTRYAHLSAIKVRVGEAVPAGQTIGLVGSTGVSTGPHLHFEVRVKDQPVDPLPLLPH